MSQNKTVVPGMDGNSYGGGYSASPQESSYSTNSKGTIVSGMNLDVETNSVHSGSSKPVVGFLYSISRQGIGEYWPLHQGENTIGSSSLCNICLQEGTVSHEHAVIVVRKMKNPEKTIASILDGKSTNGTMLNGESLGFSAVECFNGDIITIGENYELVLLLIDVKSLGLKVAENFIPMKNNVAPVMSDEPYNAHRTGIYPPPPYFNNSNYEGTDDGTVGMNGESSIKTGGTRPL